MNLTDIMSEIIKLQAERHKNPLEWAALSAMLSAGNALWFHSRGFPDAAKDHLTMAQNHLADFQSEMAK